MALAEMNNIVKHTARRPVLVLLVGYTHDSEPRVMSHTACVGKRHEVK
jgi:hypothetical protein